MSTQGCWKESGLRNLAGGDRDSVGLFQQRPSQGRGTAQHSADPAHQAGRFFDKLLAVDGWQPLPLTDAAQAVQRSAYPDAYAKWEDDATALATAVTGRHRSLRAGRPGGRTRALLMSALAA
jgi:hypothetical protein